MSDIFSQIITELSAKGETLLAEMVSDHAREYFTDSNGKEWVSSERSKSIISHQINLRWDVEQQLTQAREELEAANMRINEMETVVHEFLSGSIDFDGLEANFL